MNKIRNSKDYIETVKENSGFFENHYYHSIIDLNLVKLDSILKNGILCKSLIEKEKLVTIYTHPASSTNSKNGSEYISITRYTDNCHFSEVFESFVMHTLISLSLLIDKNIDIYEKAERDTYFFDEVFAHQYISKDKITGIILPEHLTNLPIKKINCLCDDLSCYTTIYLKKWISNMEKYFNRKIDSKEVIRSLKQFWKIFKQYDSKQQYVEMAINMQKMEYGKDLKDVLATILQELWSEKLQMNNPKFIDVISSINHDNLPIYEIGTKTLKKINN